MLAKCEHKRKTSNGSRKSITRSVCQLELSLFPEQLLLYLVHIECDSAILSTGFFFFWLLLYSVTLKPYTYAIYRAISSPRPYGQTVIFIPQQKFRVKGRARFCLGLISFISVCICQCVIYVYENENRDHDRLTLSTHPKSLLIYKAIQTTACESKALKKKKHTNARLYFCTKRIGQPCIKLNVCLFNDHFD